MAVFNCECCAEVFPDIHQHTHHRVPRSLGGSDLPSNLCHLCPGCHDTLHNIAYKLLNKKFSEAGVLDNLAIIYKDNKKAQTKCFELAIFVRNATIKERETGKNPDSLCNITTVLRKTHKDYMTIRCREMSLSQEEYLRQLVLQDIRRRFNLSIDPAAEGKLINLVRKSKGAG